MGAVAVFVAWAFAALLILLYFSLRRTDRGLGAVVPLVLFVILLFLIAAVLRVWVLFFCVWFLAAFLLLLLLSLRTVVRGLRVTRRLPGRAFAGDEIALDVTVRNTSRIPLPYLELVEPAAFQLRSGTVHAEVVSLGGKQEAGLHLDLVCRQRGYYRLNAVTGTTGDVIGLKTVELEWDAGRQLIVYPRVVPLERLGLPTHSALAALPAASRFIEDPSRVIGVRTYTPDDPMRRIHWTASARTGELVVKRLQSAIARDTTICLDLNPENYGPQWRQATEQAIVVAASLANHILIREKLPIGLITEAWDPLAEELVRMQVPPKAGRGQLISILERLARLRADRTARVEALLVDTGVRLSWGSTIVIVTGTLDGGLAASLSAPSRRGHALAVIEVRPAHLARRPPVPSGVTVHRVWDDAELADLV